MAVHTHADKGKLTEGAYDLLAEICATNGMREGGIPAAARDALRQLRAEYLVESAPRITEPGGWFGIGQKTEYFIQPRGDRGPRIVQYVTAHPEEARREPGMVSFYLQD